MANYLELFSVNYSVVCVKSLEGFFLHAALLGHASARGGFGAQEAGRYRCLKKKNEMSRSKLNFIFIQFYGPAFI